jgi:hypothetical protein
MITISKAVIKEHVDELLNKAQLGIEGKTLSKAEWESMQEKLWRIKHYINQGGNIHEAS